MYMWQDCIPWKEVVLVFLDLCCVDRVDEPSRFCQFYGWSYVFLFAFMVNYSWLNYFSIKRNLGSPYLSFNIWSMLLKRNVHFFRSRVFSLASIILKINFMLWLWLNIDAMIKRVKWKILSQQLNLVWSFWDLDWLWVWSQQGNNIF